MGKNKALFLAVVIAVLATATTAFGYHERWNNWFSAGTLTYNRNDYTKAGSFPRDTIYDSTYSPSRDTFYHPLIQQGDTLTIRFVYSADNDTIFLYIGSITGGKNTGTSGTKEGNGIWSGRAIRTKNGVETTWSSVSGTWDTADANDYFNYNTTPPSYSAKWNVTSSDPTGLTGGGTFGGERTYYSL
jgi:hypothetical protein